LETAALGALTELMVEAEILAGSDGRLIPSKVEPDVDHRDIVVAEVGGFGALWLQVKGTAHLDKTGRVTALAAFQLGAIPESPRLLYVVCLLDIQLHQLARIWLVPSAEFNRLAYREHGHRPSHIYLEFACNARGDQRWDQFEVPRLELAARLEPLVAALGPAKAEELSALRAQIPSGLGLSP
jgi:hypothetical protein